MIREVQPVFYANRLKESKKVFCADDDEVYFELGLDNSFYKACYCYVLGKHFGIEVPEVLKVKKEGFEVFCQHIFQDWEEFDSTQNFSFASRKRVNQLKNPIRIIRQSLFDEEFMVQRFQEEGYNLALVKSDKYRIVSRDYFQSMNSQYQKADLIRNSSFFRNIVDCFSLEELIQEVENYFGLHDELIEEKILLLSAYLKESKYKELFLSYLHNEERNKEISKSMIETLYLMKR